MEKTMSKTFGAKSGENQMVQGAALSLVPSPEQIGPGPDSGQAKLPPDLSPRSRLFSVGPGELSPAELLSVCLSAGKSTGEARSLTLATELLTCRDGLHGLLRSSACDLLEVPGIGEARASVLLAAVELGKRLATLAATGPGLPQVSSPADVSALLRDRIAYEDREHFIVLLLNTKNRVIGSPTVSIGTLSSSLVHPREVFKPAIKAGAAFVLLAHNHPSGHVEPSREDREVTKRLVEAGEMVGIEVLDHVILGGASSYSLKEHGLL